MRLSRGSAIICSQGIFGVKFPITSTLPLGDFSTILQNGRGGVFISLSSEMPKLASSGKESTLPNGRSKMKQDVYLMC